MALDLFQCVFVETVKRITIENQLLVNSVSAMKIFK